MAYELLSREVRYKGKIFEFSIDLVRFQSGADIQLDVIHHRGGAAVVALTEKQEVILVKQYRHPMGEYVLELPAGKIEIDETPEKTAFKELVEETGFKAEKLELLTIAYPAPGYCSERLYIYLAHNLTEVERNPDFDEEIDVVYVPFKEACEMISRGEIKDAKTIIGLLTTERLRK
jgi:ADP-ribose pyrophosphatase